MDISFNNYSGSEGEKKKQNAITLTSSSPLLGSRESIQNSGSSLNQVKGTTWYAAVILLVNTCIGAGMLNMASAFNNVGGLPVGISAQIVLSFLLGASMMILCYCSDFNNNNTFQDVVYSMCGKKVMAFCSVLAVLYAFGLVVAFMIIIGDQLDIFITFAYGPTYCLHWYLSRPFMMFTTICLFVLPLCFPARIDFLKYASFVGFVAVYYTIGFLITRYFITDYPNKGTIHWGPRNFPSIFGVVPTTLFAYQCHLSIVPIYSCLEKRNMRELSKLMAVAMPLIVFAFSAAGSFGYMTFGTHINQDVLLSYRPVTPDLMVATILIAAKMYTDAPILTFVGRTAVDSIYCYVRQVSEQNIVKYEKRRRIIIASIWFSCALTLAILLPHIGVVIAVMGGFAAVFSVLIPGICLLQALLKGHTGITKEQVHSWRTVMIIAGFYILLGTFLFVLIEVQAIIVDVTGKTPPSSDLPIHSLNTSHMCS